MPTFIQLRDGIGYAVVRTHGEPDHSITPDHTTAVLCEDENPEQYLNKKYDEKSNTWSDAELIVFGEVDNQGRIIEIRRTFFIHEADGKPILTPEVQPDWRWINNEWVIPEIIEVEQLAVEAPKLTAEEERLIRENPNYQG